MGLFKVAQRLWTGRVIKDYGPIGDRTMARGLTHRSLAVVLSDHGGPRLFIRESWKGLGAFRVNFIELDRDEASRLREIIDDALPEM